MTFISLIIGVVIFLVGVVIIISPDKITNYLRKYQHHSALRLRIAAVVARFLIGVLLVSQADLSKFPLAIKLIGWVSIVAAVVLLVMGSQNFQRLMSWALSKANLYMRVGGVVGIALGAFIAYAFYR